MQTATSISALKGITGTSNEIGILLGALTPGDGGGGTFYYDTNSALSENEGTIVKPTGPPTANGRWIRIYEGTVNVKWFASKVVGGNWSPAVQAAIQVNGAIFLPYGSYLINTPLTNAGDTSIEGESVDHTTLYTTSDINIINFTSAGSITIRNLKFSANTIQSSGAAIRLVFPNPIAKKVGHIENIRILRSGLSDTFKYGITVTNPQELVLRDIVIEGNGISTLIGVDLLSNREAFSPTIQNVKVYDAKIGLQVKSGVKVGGIEDPQLGIEGVKVLGCDFTRVETGVVVDNLYGGPGFNLDNCHVNAKLGCLSIKNINQIFISDSLFYMEDDALYGIDLVTVHDGSISCCKFFAQGAAAPHGILANGTAVTTEIKVIHNYFFLNSTGNQTGIWFGPSSNRNQALYNTVEGLSSGFDVLNQGANNVLVGNIRHNIE
jgi:hypothetical protein